MSSFIKEVTQTVPFETYKPTNCGNTTTGKCYNGDWRYGTETCDAGLAVEQPQCSKLNTSVCAITANLTIQWKPDQSPSSKGAIVQCIYPAGGFTQASYVNTYTEKFGTDIYWKTNIMPQFCKLQSTDCIVDPQTNEKMPMCSNMSDVGEAGALCRQWIASDVQYADPTKVDYCDSFNTADCECMNRSRNPVYNAVKPGNPFNDGCWFIPCSNDSVYLTPTDLIDPKCPTTVCSVVNAIINNSNTTITAGEISQYISCNNTGSPSPIVQFLEKYKWVIAAIILVLLFILFLISFSFKKNKKK